MEGIKKDQKIVIDSSCHFEHISNFIGNIREEYPNLNEKELKIKALFIIKILLKKRILNVQSVKSYGNWDLNVDDIINRLYKTCPIWIGQVLNLILMKIYLTKDAISKTTQSNGVIIANMGNGNFITFRPVSASASGFPASINYNFQELLGTNNFVIKFTP